VPETPAEEISPSRLERRAQRRLVGGVCAGLAEHLGVEVVVVRLAFAVLISAGVGVVAYVALWLLVPQRAEPPAPTPSTKPAPAETQHPVTAAAPRSALAHAAPAPAAASPTHRQAPAETPTAMSAPPTPAPQPRGAAPSAPSTGKAPQTGFGVAVEDPPGGVHPAVFDAYLASVRDKIMTKRELLKTFQYSREQVVIWMILDDKGRLAKFDVAQSAFTSTFEHYVKNMIAMAPYFGPPPPGLAGRRLFFYLAIPETQAEWDEMMATGRPPGGAG